MHTYVYNRILLKLSGEALKGDSDELFNETAVNEIVNRIGTVRDKGVEIGLVIGGGNIWRGAKSTNQSLTRTSADYIGMLATVMNAIYLRDVFNAAGFSAEVQTSIPMIPLAAPYERLTAIKALEEGKILIFAAGTGSPFFTTDTTAALRALEIDAQALLKATKVDGIYTDDPVKNPSALRYKTLTYEEALSKKLAIMDSTAFSMCRDNKMPIIVFNFSSQENLELVLRGDTSVATVVSE